MEKYHFFQSKKEYHIAESIYGAEYDLLIKFKKNYLTSNYKIDNNIINKKLSQKFYLTKN